jgi:hypothetical protein
MGNFCKIIINQNDPQKTLQKMGKSPCIKAKDGSGYEPISEKKLSLYLNALNLCIDGAGEAYLNRPKLSPVLASCDVF